MSRRPACACRAGIGATILFLLRNVRPSLATSYAYVNPAVAVMLGVAFKDEHITWIGVSAMVVILVGVGVLALVRSKAGIAH